MRLTKFLYDVCESAISDAVQIEEPDETKEYTEEEIKSNMAILTKAIKALKTKSDSSDLDKSSLSDFTKNLRGWLSLHKDRFGGSDSDAEKEVPGSEPKKVTAPIDPQGPMDPKLAIKLAGVEDTEDKEKPKTKQKSKKDKK